MRIVMSLVSALMLGLMSATALASEAHVCHSRPVPQSNKDAALTDDTHFSCGNEVSGTIPVFSQAGWKITQVMEQADTSALASLKPGQTPQNPDDLNKTYWVVIIQK